jgi:lipid-A-disaccharide synthase
MRIMISCGEASGDLYAGALAAAIRTRIPNAEIVGFGGERLKAAGATLIGDFAGLTVTGITEAVRVLPRSYVMYRRLIRAARQRRPDVFVAIDFPDFNFRLMAALHRRGIPVVSYVSPQIWAWRTGRIKTMKRLVDKVLVIFPFEAAIYERAGIPVEFVGHPLVEIVRVRQPRAVFLPAHGLQAASPTVALLPGSRPNEIRRIAPGIIAALPLIRARVPAVQFVVACAPNLPDELFTPFLNGASAAGAGGGAVLPPVLVRDRTDDVLAASDAVITASGTATVQATIHERPMVVVYRLSPLTYALGKPFLKVDMCAMTNLVAGRPIVPELIQEAFTAERVAAETTALLTDTAQRARMCAALHHVRMQLGPPGASARAADALIKVAAASRGSTPA